MHFITSSQKKFREAQHFLPDLEQLDVDLPEIQSLDPQEIIKAKLQAAYEHHDGAFIVEDTSLSFDCLNGLPGPLIKWFREAMGMDGLANMVEKLGNNRATASTWIGYSPNRNEQYIFSGQITGQIVRPRGEGFGWDVIFQPDGHRRTFGEMSPEEKAYLSMRAQAVRQLAEYLNKK